MCARPRLDHLVLAGPDLDAAAALVAATTGIEPSAGGPHPGFGTRNMLCSFGRGSYLEIVGPDPDQAEPEDARPFGIDRLSRPTLVAWCARVADLPAARTRWDAAELDFTPPTPMSRQASIGLLEWTLSFPQFENPGGIVPFFIDWAETPHPSATAQPGLTLSGLRATHPSPMPVNRVLRHLDLDLAAEPGDVPALFARIEGPGGRLDLSGASSGDTTG